LLGYAMRRLGISPLPFVIAFILGGNLENTARQAFAATGGDPLFLFSSPVALVFMMLTLVIITFSLRKPKDPSV
jgi:putative tricarboxylic transport membrane protein